MLLLTLKNIRNIPGISRRVVIWLEKDNPKINANVIQVFGFLASSKLNPNDDMSYAGLGYCCEMSENWECAADWYSTALKLNPENHYAAQGLTRVSRKLESEGS